ncbi:MAG TPA: hypothetical protein VFZ10_17940, partial [Geminicoccaceae bacterium]
MLDQPDPILADFRLLIRAWVTSLSGRVPNQMVLCRGTALALRRFARAPELLKNRYRAVARPAIRPLAPASAPPVGGGHSADAQR